MLKLFIVIVLFVPMLNSRASSAAEHMTGDPLGNCPIIFDMALRCAELSNTDVAPIERDHCLATLFVKSVGGNSIDRQLWHGSASKTSEKLKTSVFSQALLASLPTMERYPKPSLGFGFL